MYAQTRILYGEGVNTTDYAEGAMIEEGDLPDEIIASLIEVGALAPTPRIDSVDAIADLVAAKDAEIAELRAQLTGKPSKKVAAPTDTHPA